MHNKLHFIFVIALILWGCGSDKEISTTQPSTPYDDNNNNQSNQQINCTEGEVLVNYIPTYTRENFICFNGQWNSIERINGRFIPVDVIDFCEIGAIFYNGQTWQICTNGNWYEVPIPIASCPFREIRYKNDNSLDYTYYDDTFWTNDFICINNMWINLEYAISTFPNKLLNPSFNYGTMTDPRDGKIYRTTVIGNQIWMAENLAYTPPPPDSDFPHSLCLRQSAAISDSTHSCNVNGRLYSWKTAMGYNYYAIKPPHRGICPEGWHIPGESDFQNLSRIKGSKLATSVGWRASTHCNEGTDEYGFSAIPVGYYSPFDEFPEQDLSKAAYFWSDDELSYEDAYAFEIKTCDYNQGTAYKPFRQKALLSVRCIKD